jgi:ABC-2 type transport system ATP-binding protein
MKKKVEDAKVFVQEPKIAIFDEPTAYLDVPSRHRVWKMIEHLRDDGATILLATNMMDEADRLCGRIGILSKGRVKAVGTPSSLKDAIPQGDVVNIHIQGDVGEIAKSLKPISGVKEVVIIDPGKVRLYVTHVEQELSSIMHELLIRNVKIEAIEIKEPSLDDVFLHYAGESL